MFTNITGGASSLKEEISLGLQVVAVAEPAVAASWVKESCKIVETQGCYPETQNVSEAHFEQHQGTLKRQLASASKRLAATLNDSFK